MMAAGAVCVFANRVDTTPESLKQSRAGIEQLIGANRIMRELQMDLLGPYGLPASQPFAQPEA